MENKLPDDVVVDGVVYTAKDDRRAPCQGCAGWGQATLCNSLPGCHNIVWVRAVAKPEPQATIIIDETELRDLWKRAYIAGIGQDGISPFNAGQYAVANYKRARAEGIV